MRRKKFAHAYTRANSRAQNIRTPKTKQKCSNQEDLLRGKTFKKRQTSVDEESYGASRQIHGKLHATIVILCFFEHEILGIVYTRGTCIEARRKAIALSLHAIARARESEEDAVNLTADDKVAFVALVRRRRMVAELGLAFVGFRSWTMVLYLTTEFEERFLSLVYLWKSRFRR